MFIKMAKTILMLLGAFFLLLITYSKFTGHTRHWNKNTGIDVKQEFTRAYLLLPDNSMRVLKVKSWNDYEYSDHLQFTTEDGRTYLTHASRVILTDEKDGQN